MSYLNIISLDPVRLLVHWYGKSVVQRLPGELFLRVVRDVVMIIDGAFS
jgi:hypothetical protein